MTPSEEVRKLSSAPLVTDRYLFNLLSDLLGSYTFIKFWREGPKMRVLFSNRVDGPCKGLTISMDVRSQRN